MSLIMYIHTIVLLSVFTCCGIFSSTGWLSRVGDAEPDLDRGDTESSRVMTTLSRPRQAAMRPGEHEVRLDQCSLLGTRNMRTRTKLRCPPVQPPLDGGVAACGALSLSSLLARARSLTLWLLFSQPPQIKRGAIKQTRTSYLVELLVYSSSSA